MRIVKVLIMCSSGGGNISPQIRNNELPACKNCIYYRPYPYSDYASHLGECTRFGEKNILTDKIVFDLVVDSRKNEDKCGIKGRFFIQDSTVFFKQGRHFLVKNAPLLGLGLFAFIYLFLAFSLNSH